MLGHPSRGQSRDVIEAAVQAGAAGLELGFPFSDPIADGPVIHAAATTALQGGFRIADAFEQIRDVRQRHPDLPIGLLVYGNLVRRRGLDTFYGDVSKAGVDAVLVADVPMRESGPFVEAASTASVDPVFIAPPNATESTLRSVATHSRSFVYCVCRAGVTGAGTETRLPPRHVVEGLRQFGAAPAVAGFGLSNPEHVFAAHDAGMAGAIVGSALIRIIDEDPAGAPGNVEAFVKACVSQSR